MSNLRFKTIESCQEIHDQLYSNDPNNSTFTCRIIVPVGEDVVQELELTLHVARKYGVRHEYRLANGDLIYRTTASVEPEGETFDIDIVLRFKEMSVEGATISMSDKVNCVIERIENRD